jgi:uncharacterized membrane protein
MSPASVRAGRWIGLGVLGTYPFVIHMIFVLAGSSVAGTVLVLAELALVSAVAILQFRRGLVLAALGGGVMIVLFGDAASGVIVAVSGIPHAVTNAGLLTVFGSSLLPGRKPLITTLAERLNLAPLAPELTLYTRTVTLAWCCFFALELVASLFLLLLAPLATWSFFVNVLTLPLVVAMFLGEYTYRRLRFRSYRHRTILQVVEAFSTGEAFKASSVSGPPRQ